MQFREIIERRWVSAELNPANKKQLFEQIAERVARDTGLKTSAVFDALGDRERLGSTAIGGGIAVPHARLEGLEQILPAFFKLQSPVDYDAPDGEMIDLVFLVLVPDEDNSDHLQALSCIARLARSEGTMRELREQASEDGLYDVLTRPVEIEEKTALAS